MSETVSNSSDVGSIKAPRYAIVGVVPPPFGGVSVHIARKLELLRNNGIDARLYERTGKSDKSRGIYPLGSSALKFVWFLLRFKEPVVHFHFSNHAGMAITGLILNLRPRKKYVITIHGEGILEHYRKRGWLFRWALIRCFRRAEQLICVNQNLVNFLTTDLGIVRSRVSLIPAFLPPSASEMQEDQIPDSVADFIEDREYVVGTHGWFGFFQDGIHIYSFDHIAELARQIVESGRNIAMYTMISGCYDQDHRDEILSLHQGLSKNWLIVEEPFSCAALYKKTDLFVRPTTTDGDSVSIRECLALGVNVLASDAVPRPDGCHLYPTRDLDQLKEKFWELIGRERSQQETPPGLLKRTSDELLSVVRKCVNAG
jgi:glycosyltransferase involved in cell wall biosynthesis